MLTIKKFGIGGVGPFKKQVSLDIVPGITYLYGKDITKGGNGNAAGKSLFAASSAEIFYDTPLVGHKQDRAKKGSRFIEFVKDGKTVRIETVFNGKSEKVSIEISGKDGTERTNKMTKEAARKLWSISETDYRTYAYLDSQVPHPLVRGSTTERKEFFTSFFRLDILDAEKKIFQAELLRVKKARTALIELETAYKDLTKDLLPREKYIEYSENLARLEKRLETLRDQSASNARLQRLLDFESYAGPNLTKLKKLVDDLDDFHKIHKSFQRRLAVAKERESQLEEYKLYRRELKNYKDAISDLDMDASMEDLREASEAYQKASSKCTELEDLEAPKKVRQPQKPESDRDLLVARRSKLKHEREHFLKFKKGICETCGQSVKVSSPEKVKANLLKVEAELEEWDTYLEDLETYKAFLKEQEAYNKDVALLEKAKAIKKKNKELHELYKKRSSLKEPTQVEKPEDVEEIEFLQKRLAVLDFCKPHIETIRDLETLTEQDRNKRFDLTELDGLQEEVTEVKIALEIHKSVRGKAKNVKSRIEEISVLVENEKALELLVEGYAEKAIKKMAVEAISQRLMSTVNKYAPLVFEDYHFEFVWNSQISLLVSRNGGEPTDVRKLSGAESKLFTLILVLSLLMFVPKAKRLSLIILDEPLASFSEETGELFHKLLPHIQQVIPSILVVTPDARERFEGANEFTVVKTSKGSQIVQGHPSTI